MRNGDEASPSFNLAGRARFVGMLITLEPRGAFGSKCAYLCILSLSSHWYATRLRGFTEHYFRRPTFK